ncbi:MAG: PIN domain-containing protein [Comamonadaceae bacterium]|nr:PIN domain-containing protein [Comamonadaceae bacterium]
MSLPEGHAPRAAPPRLVIDTQWVLDLFVFEDPRAAPLRTALQQARVQWLATQAMRDELARVLGYPLVARRLAAGPRSPAHVLAAFDRHACLHPAPPTAPPLCRDPDDQMFIDLAVAHRATLLSKDRLVLALARRLRPLGVRVAPMPGAPELGAVHTAEEGVKA